jgi:fimbrial chaperone protein
MTTRRSLTGLFIVLVVGISSRVQAGQFQVNPVLVELSAAQKSATVKVHNQGPDTTTFHVTGFVWQQARTGEMELLPSSELIFFPSMLKLAAGETRLVRVGSTASSDQKEKSYRIVVEELPALKRTEEGTRTAVQVLTRMTLPVFVAPLHPSARASFERVTLEKGKLVFTLRNSGTVRFRATGVRMVARVRTGEKSFERTEPGWYVLGGGERDYEVHVPPEVCAHATSLELHLQAEGVQADASVPVTKSSCAR